MKIVVAPNAFKDSLSADAAAKAITRGILRVAPDAQTVHVPIADGGDGLFDVFKTVFGGETIAREVTGPLGKPMTADFLYIPGSKTAVIEMARASGLALLGREERNARATTTRGTGELILAAVEKGAKKILVGIGGSATNDGGMGLLAALGVRFYNGGRELFGRGEDLERVTRVDLSGLLPQLSEVQMSVICDVTNPLLGPDGATYI
ncbi:MAG: glycerate kinase, partial [Planctomycetota bacterium]|nr:glycerate kinase [Planctomycetota bacterium]